MGYIRKKVAGNTKATFNTKTGHTRYTTTNKVGNTTLSSSHKGNKTRSTKTTTVNGVVSRTSSSYSPPKMKAPKPVKTKKPKSRKVKYSGKEVSFPIFKIFLAIIIFFVLLGIIS